MVSNLDDLWDFYNPEFLMLSLQACRPKYMREHGHVCPPFCDDCSPNGGRRVAWPCAARK